MVKHDNAGSLWVRKTKSGATTLCGYFWFYDRTARKKRIFTVKVKRNPNKGNAAAADYCIYDYTKERENARKVSIYDTYRETLTAKAGEAARKKVPQGGGGGPV